MIVMSGQSTSDVWIYRIGGVAAVVGSVAGMVGNLIHPATPIGDPRGVARVIAESNAWTPIHLVIIASILLMLGGLVSLAYSIRGGWLVRWPASAWRRRSSASL